jgi:hypothetical protein
MKEIIITGKIIMSKDGRYLKDTNYTLLWTDNIDHAQIYNHDLALAIDVVHKKHSIYKDLLTANVVPIKVVKQFQLGEF